jgi:predicted DNA-binding transcriptional regulator
VHWHLKPFVWRFDYKRRRTHDTTWYEPYEARTVYIQLYNGLIWVQNTRRQSEHFYKITSLRREIFSKWWVELVYAMSETYIIFKPIASICERGKLMLLKELEQVNYAMVRTFWDVSYAAKPRS